MAIGTPRVVGLASGSNTGATITTTADINAGDVILVINTCASLGFSLRPPTDSAGNFYNKLVVLVPGAGACDVMMCENALALATGGTITITTGGTASNHGFIVLAVSGFPTGVCLDSHPNGTSGTGTSSTSITSGTLAQAAELLIGIIYSGSTFYSGFAANGSWTATTGGQTATSLFTKIAHQIVAATTAVAYVPTWTPSVAWRNELFSIFAGFSAQWFPAGQSTLSCDATHPGSATATLAGAGAISCDSFPAQFATAELDGAGALACNAVHTPLGAAALAGAGALASDSVHTPSGAVVLAGAGALACATVYIALGVANVAGAGAIACNGVHVVTASAALAGEGFLTLGLAILAGAGALTCNGVHAVAASATLAGEGFIAADAQGPPLVLATGFVSGQATNLTTAFDYDLGDTVVIFASSGSSNTALKRISDDSGNAAPPHVPDATATSIGVAVMYPQTFMAAGGHITVFFEGASAAHILIAYLFKGVLLRPDAIPNRNQGTGTTTTITSAALASDREIALGMVAFSATTEGTFSPGAGFTLLGQNTGTRHAYGVYQLSPLVAGFTWTPSWSSSSVFGARALGLEQIAALVRGAGSVDCDAQHVAVPSTAALAGIGALTVGAAEYEPASAVCAGAGTLACNAQRLLGPASAALVGTGRIACLALLAPVLLGHAVSASSTSLDVTTLVDLNPGDTIAVFVEAEGAGSALLAISDDAGNVAPPTEASWAYYHPQQAMAAGGTISLQFGSIAVGHSAIIILFRGMILVRDSDPSQAVGTGTSASIASGALVSGQEYLLGHVIWNGSNPGNLTPGAGFGLIDQVATRPAAVVFAMPGLAGATWATNWQFIVTFRARLESMQPAFAILRGSGAMISLIGSAILAGSGAAACNAVKFIPPSSAGLAGAGMVICDAQHLITGSCALSGVGSTLNNAIHGCAAAADLDGGGAVFCYAWGPPVRLGSASALGVNLLQITTLADIAPGDTILFMSSSVNASSQLLSIIDDAGNFAPNTLGDQNTRGADYNEYLATQPMAAGGKITIRWGGAAQGRAAIALLFRDMVMVRDSAISSSTGTSTTASKATGTLSAAGEYVVGQIVFTSAPGGTINPGPGFVLADQTTTVPMAVAYQTVGGTGSVTFNPSWPTSGTFRIRAPSFQPGIWLFGAGTATGATAINASAALAGGGALSANAPVPAVGSTLLAGAGGLTADATHPLEDSPTLAGAGAILSDGGGLLTSMSTLAGAGTVSAASLHLAPDAPTLAGSGFLVVSPVVPGQINAGLPGEGFIAADTERPEIAGSADLVAAGGVFVAGAAQLLAVTSLQGAGALNVPGALRPVARGSLLATGGLAASAAAALAATGVLPGAGALAATAAFLWFDEAALAGEGTLDSAPIARLSASATLLGAGSVLGDGEGRLLARASLAGSGTVLGDAIRQAPASASLAGAGTLAATGMVQIGALSTLAGAGGVQASAGHSPAATVTLAGVGALAANATALLPISATLAGAGALLVLAVSRQRARASVAGAGAITTDARKAMPVTLAKLAGAGRILVDATNTPRATTVLAGRGAFAHAWGFWITHIAASLAGAGAVRVEGMPAQFGSRTLAGEGRFLADAFIQPWTGFCVGSDEALASVNTAEDIFEVVE